MILLSEHSQLGQSEKGKGMETMTLVMWTWCPTCMRVTNKDKETPKAHIFWSQCMDLSGSLEGRYTEGIKRATDLTWENSEKLGGGTRMWRHWAGAREPAQWQKAPSRCPALVGTLFSRPRVSNLSYNRVTYRAGENRLPGSTPRVSLTQ